MTATVEMVHERVGIVITREDTPRHLAAQEVQYRAYKDPKRRAEARRQAVDYALSRALEPRSPITIDWATNEVFASEGGWTRQIATFTTEQYQIEQVPAVAA
ncbi:hypothetical protein [Rothia sp. P4278]|uniref:hypothetical protein n=1 Tax=Rothia sp. P4278 TaxID=3402658 RepID=UPI003AE906E6